MDESNQEKSFSPIVGTEDSKIDSKGRIFMAKSKRDKLGKNFVLARGNLDCIVAFPQSAWEKLCNEILSYPSINQGRDMLSRLTMAEAHDDISCDDQGRFVIPETLRKIAELVVPAGETKDLKLVGLGDRVEIWDLAKWTEFNKYPESYAKDRREQFTNSYERLVAGA
jgi:MraZ protein